MKKFICLLMFALVVQFVGCSDASSSKIEYKDIQWPRGYAGQIVPQPESLYGSISWEHEKSFRLCIADITLDDFTKYVDSCYEAGFAVDYDRGETYYRANNADGYHLSLKYDSDESCMWIGIDEPREESSELDEIPDPTKAPSPTPTPTESATAIPSKAPTEAPSESNPNGSKEAVSGIRPEFQDAMNSYEKFFDEYVEFMKSYMNSDDTLSMLSDFTTFTSQYDEIMKKLDDIDENKLSSEELSLYTEVMARISQKIAAIYTD